MNLVVWIDEEVGGFSRVTRKLTARSVDLKEALSAGEALTWHRTGGCPVTPRRAVLVVDMMLAAGDHAPEFRASNTYDYMLTGLELLKILEEEELLSNYQKVVIYTALKDEQYLSIVRAWTEPRTNATGLKPIYEIRSKANFDHDEMLEALLRDLGM